ncbi:MAG TPA: helix-turn-helix domain-containing protein [Candidatus Competibacteraceae bacterium]|nr:helix-turn-helix domain-containing protein [Candidatus Competibacteraceae bacterium]HSA47764.1 helix-turn-helix domain-containing protein [Candidatus Competibacteraceae bacterium]
MPAPRFIQWEGQEWSINRLARAYHLPTSTLNHRLERFGETATGIQRALATGIVDCRTAGRIGATRSPWRYPG